MEATMCPDNNNKGSGRGSDSSSWMTAAALAGSAAFFVGKAMFKGAKWAGGAISDNTRTLYNTIIDDKQKFDEIKRIEAYCTEIKENLEKEQAWRERSMNIEAAHYGELCRKYGSLGGKRSGSFCCGYSLRSKRAETACAAFRVHTCRKAG